MLNSSTEIITQFSRSNSFDDFMMNEVYFEETDFWQLPEQGQQVNPQFNFLQQQQNPVQNISSFLPMVISDNRTLCKFTATIERRQKSNGYCQNWVDTQIPISSYPIEICGDKTTNFCPKKFHLRGFLVLPDENHVIPSAHKIFLGLVRYDNEPVCKPEVGRELSDVEYKKLQFKRMGLWKMDKKHATNEPVQVRMQSLPNLQYDIMTDVFCIQSDAFSPGTNNPKFDVGFALFEERDREIVRISEVAGKFNFISWHSNAKRFYNEQSITNIRGPFTIELFSQQQGRYSGRARN
mmetsp:Transcript_4030/g.15172  ORF Transcript_4030/g.15172 Transcript_4030/m.15172 type:complete len:294 (-) Transcript_4030:194-1075(-)